MAAPAQNTEQNKLTRPHYVDQLVDSKTRIAENTTTVYNEAYLTSVQTYFKKKQTQPDQKQATSSASDPYASLDWTQAFATIVNSAMSARTEEPMVTIINPLQSSHDIHSILHNLLRHDDYTNQTIATNSGNYVQSDEAIGQIANRLFDHYHHHHPPSTPASTPIEIEPFIASLPSVKESKKQGAQNYICSICKETIVSPNTLRILPCFQRACDTCLLPTFRQSFRCPFCRICCESFIHS